LGLEGVLVDLGERGAAELTALSAWEIMNVPTGAILDLRDAMSRLAEGDPRVAPLLKRYSIGMQGYLGFHRLFEAVTGEALAEPVVLLPSTKHYSWSKIANLLGMGQGQLLELPLDANYRIDPARFAAVTERLLNDRVPVLALMTVLGSTETGSIDQIARLFEVKAEAAAAGLEMYCHVDGAYGGYATAMFRDPQGRWVSWSPYGSDVAASFKALPLTDSITIDPHKLGYAPYPAGALIFADRRLREFLSTDAPYVFYQEGDGQHHAIGQYIVEGSKPGVAAAAVWLNHRVMPLDTSGYGALIGGTVASAKALKEALMGFKSAAGFKLIPLNEPDLNLVTFIAVPPGVRSVAELNRFNEALYQRFAVDAERVVFTYEFLVSKTAFDVTKYEAGLKARLEPALLAMLEDTVPLTVLRTTIMNPFVAAAIEDGSYFRELLSTLESEMRSVAAEQGLTAEATVRPGQRIKG
ncbi:MAG: pyridoxal phosphate-dependent decarboxylase family protein, partial [Candidatus Sericytochromatia bacterium]